MTIDGRVLTGIPLLSNDAGVTLVDNQGETTIIRSSDIEAVSESNVSQMRDDLYRTPTPQELRDLFAWLQSDGPLK